MKAQILIAAVALTLSACSSQKMSRNGSSGNNDDIYYSSSDAVKEGESVYTEPDPSAQQPQASEYTAAPEAPVAEGSEQRFDYTQEGQAPAGTYTETDGAGNTYITNNYYGDYYDYEYSSRVKRFYTDVNLGVGYYDGWYTNAYYYDYNPWSWGVSIYLGYSFWSPVYVPYYNYCYTPYTYYAYNPWYSPYNGCGGYYGCGGCGGCGGYYGYSNPYYFNSYDSHSYYYGPRPRNYSGATHSGGGTTTHLASLYEREHSERPSTTPMYSNPRTIKTVSEGSENVPVKTNPQNPAGYSATPSTPTKGGTSAPANGNTGAAGYSTAPSKGNPAGENTTPAPVKGNTGTGAAGYSTAPSKGNPAGENTTPAPVKGNTGTGAAGYSTAPSKGNPAGNNPAPVKGNTGGAAGYSTAPSKGNTYTPSGNTSAPKGHPQYSKPQTAPKGNTYSSPKGNTYSNPSGGSGNTNPRNDYKPAPRPQSTPPTYSEPRKNSQPSAPSAPAQQSKPRSYEQPKQQNNSGYSRPSNSGGSSQPSQPSRGGNQGGGSSSQPRGNR